MDTPERRDIVGVYSKLAVVYDAWTRLTERESLSAALERAAIRDGEAVLEVAVGTGVLFDEILRRNLSGRNVGIDLTEPMLRRAREKARQTGTPFELVVGDARALSFDDGSFDLVVNNNMFGLLPESEFAPILAEMWRVLKPGGRLVLVMMMRPDRLLPELVYRIGAVWLGGWREVRIEPFVRAAGFAGLESELVTQLGIPSEVLLARKPGSQAQKGP
jgi:ubiquinone/menaquinone biosynthesis C-methylase UbiE